MKDLSYCSNLLHYSLDSTATHASNMEDVNQGNGNSNPTAGGSGLNLGHVVQQQEDVIDPAQHNVAAQLAQQILANTNVTLKQEVIKLPEFYGQAGKDTISTMDFISRIDECQTSSGWNDFITFTNFRLVLWGEAEKWLASKVCHLKLTPAQKHGPGLGLFSRRNSQPYLMTSSSLMAWQNLLTDQMKILECSSQG